MTSSTIADSSVTFLPQGALIQEFVVKGRNIVLGFHTANPYTYLNAPFFGETIGRFANRLQNGLLRNVNGRDYQLAQNDGTNSIHGGSVGWGKRIFTGPHPCKRNGKESVQFRYVSPDGEEGYPGTVEVRVWYSTAETVEDGIDKIVLEAEYEVELVGDECDETPINLSNHSYFNITGGASIEGTKVVLGTDQYLPVDRDQIPLGTIEKYPGITQGVQFELGREKPDVDHCFIIDTDARNVPVDTRNRQTSKLISLSNEATGIHLDVFSTEPAFQFYTGEHINVPDSEHGPKRASRAGLCIEPSRYINAVNVAEWRNMAMLRRGELYGARHVYKAWKV